ncbi:cation-translocating P-type ATPase [Thermodesulfovibrio yellowstonii]|uniref:ATPase n=1 Tax=Thermodesulfovibrio yellowstonii TaxID=28262 RepID=A0A9W6GF25_9BACT|nr:cation-transporting P-type ATPase [Thermodesulfovibrio islandicus]GLI54113.1 ATPase [Thermodesulfovibrio islandicus]
MKINEATKEELFKLLDTSEAGLTEDEAKRRLSHFGFNEIKEARKTPLILKFLNQFTHFLAIILWLAAALAFLSDWIHPGEGMRHLGFAIIGVIVINAIFVFVQEYRAEKAIEKLKLMLPFYVKVIREGTEKQILAREIVPGDLIILSEGDKVPADARVIESNYLTINNAPLTGESLPVVLTYEPETGDLIQSKNIAFAGATVVSGNGKAVVFATGMSTEFGRIAHLTQTVHIQPTPLQREIARTSRFIALVATLIGLTFFIIGHTIGRSFWENFIFAIGVIVALVPEGMLPTVTLSLALGSQRMLKRNALVKKLTSVEALGSITVICTDKTGTITQNKMEVKRLWMLNQNPETLKMLLKIAYLCNNAKFVEGQYRGDPTEVALLKYARENIGDLVSERVSEIPFDFERKRMTTVNIIDGRQLSLTKGAVETVLPLCRYALINGEKVEINEEIKEKINHAYHSLMDEGLRVLCFAYSEDEPEKDMLFVGLIGLEDPPRPEVKEAIRKCHEAGVRIILITGDASRTALAIAKEIGLVKDAPVIIEAEEFHKMTDSELREKLKEKEILFTRMTPKDKLRIVTLLQESGEIVAVTGDGVNDAPALKKADIGVAMGSGTDVAKESAEIILLDDNFATIVNAIEEGRAVYENIRKFISYFFTSNVAELVPYIAYAVFRIPLPLTIMQILSIDLGTDILPALALGVEKPTKEIMKQPPRSHKERLLNMKVLLRVFLILGPIEAAAGLFGYFYVLKGGGWQWGEALSATNILYMQATTACLTGIVLAQVANGFVSRSFRESVFSLGILSNKLLLAGVLFEIALQIFIVYHPLGNSIFSTYPIPFSVWLVLIPFAVFLFVVEEVRKIFKVTF